MSTLRPATPRERPRVGTLVKACGPQVRDYFGIRDLPRHYEQGHVWVVEGPTGHFLAFAVAVPLKREQVTSLYEFGVHPDARRHGIGSSLLAACAQGRPLRMVVNGGNDDALSFYLSNGLAVTSSKITKGGRFLWVVEGTPTS